MKMFRKIWNVVYSVIVAVVVLLAVAFVGVRVVGLQPFTVLSGSMEPTYHTGSLIYVKSVNRKKINVLYVVKKKVSLLKLALSHAG